MIIAGVIALCIVILILAFLFPRLSRAPAARVPEGDRARRPRREQGPGQARPLVQQAVQHVHKAVAKSARRGPQGPREDAVLGVPGAGFEPARP